MTTPDTPRPVALDIYRTAIPMRGFAHAAARRNEAEAIVVRQEFSDGTVGWGETLPRPYVTGETLDSVVADIEHQLWPRWVRWWRRREARPGLQDLADAACPRGSDGRCLNAARAGLELSALSAIELPALASRIRVRVSGVLGSRDPDRTARRTLQMRWLGLRDFKLKVGFGADVDQANLDVVTRQIGKAIRKGKCTLRVDVNGGWSVDQTPDRVAQMAASGICAVEQPVYVPADELVDLSRRCSLPLIADESLLTIEDGAVLAPAGDRIWWNIRISKNGGLTTSMALARMAAEAGAPLIVGCMVGETSLLSAAQRGLLQLIPSPRFVEGNYGRFLLKGELVGRRVMMGFGGRLRALTGRRLTGLRVDSTLLERFATHAARLETSDAG